MKTKLIFFLSCFIVWGGDAQEMKYFEVDSTTGNTAIFLRPKDIEIDRSAPLQGHYYLDISKKDMQMIYNIYKEVFGDVDKQTETALFRGGRVFLLFNRDLQIYYYDYTFFKRYSPLILSIEDKLLQFIEKMKRIDLSEFIEIDNRTEFKDAHLSIPFGVFINYGKNPDTYTPQRIRY